MKKFFGCAALVVALLLPTPASASKPTASKGCGPIVALYRELLRINREGSDEGRRLEIDAWKTAAHDGPEALKAEFEFIAQNTQWIADGNSKAGLNAIKKVPKVEAAVRDYIFENCPHAKDLWNVSQITTGLQINGSAAKYAQCVAKHLVADHALMDDYLDALDSGVPPQSVRDMLEACKKLPHL